MIKITLFYSQQIKSAQEAQSIADIFSDDENTSLLSEAGYRKAISINEKDSIIKTLCDYHTLIKFKAEIDDFVKGLKVMGVFEAVLNYPTLMKPFFVIVNDKKLNKGMLPNHKKHVLVFVYSVSHTLIYLLNSYYYSLISRCTFCEVLRVWLHIQAC